MYLCPKPLPTRCSPFCIESGAKNKEGRSATQDHQRALAMNTRPVRFSQLELEYLDYQVGKLLKGFRLCLWREA